MFLRMFDESVSLSICSSVASTTLLLHCFPSIFLISGVVFHSQSTEIDFLMSLCHIDLYNLSRETLETLGSLKGDLQ